MIPEKFKNYMFNEQDYLPQDYKVEDPEKLALIKQLVCMISDDMDLSKPQKVHENEPDVWLLDRMLTKDEVKFMLSFKKKRVVKLTAEEIAERNQMSVEDARARAEHIAEIGLLEYDRDNKEKVQKYFVPRWVVGSGEYMMMNGKLLEKHPEVATFFNYASSVAVGKVAAMVPPGGGGVGMHVKIGRAHV